MPDFAAFIDELVTRLYDGVDGRLAEAIGMSKSGFSRAIKNEGTLNVENCLRLAAETGEPPSKVLRLAGKATVAELIEQLYGEAALPLTKIDRELLALPPGVKREALRLLSLYSEAVERGEVERPPARRELA